MPLNLFGPSIKTLTGVYALARKSGWLNTSLGQRAFTSSYFLYKRYIEDPYYHLIRRHPELFRGGHILDVGANIGYTARAFSRAIDAGYKVYSFEPDEFNFSLLRRLAASAKASGRIEAIRSAVGDHDGTIELWINEHHHADHRIMTDQLRETKVGSRSEQVSILKLDTFVESQTKPFPICFIKVDVQGFEIAVCKGMELTLARNPNAVLTLEYMPDAMSDLGFQPEELLDWVRTKQFNIYSLKRNGTLAPGTPDSLRSGEYGDLVLARQRIQV
jgi:FkbM family methyltransferase